LQIVLKYSHDLRTFLDRKDIGGFVLN